MLKKVCILVISLFFAPVILAKSIVVGVSMYSLADKYPTYL
jgi:D-ribose transporter subunit